MADNEKTFGEPIDDNELDKAVGGTGSAKKRN